MKKKIFNLLKRFWPIIFIFVVWFTFASPYFLKGKVPFPSTYLVNFFAPYNAYPGFSSPVKNNAMPDVISQIYPWKNLTVDMYKTFNIPLWNPYSFSGTPLLANYQSAVLSPFNILFLFLPFIEAWSLQVLIQPLLAGIFMFLFLKSLRVSSEGSLIGSVSFMFCGFITTWMAYGTLSFAILFLPLALFAIEKFYEKGYFRYLFLFSLTIPLSFFSGHFQTSIYFFGFVSLYLIFKSISERNNSKAILTFLYLLFGVLLSLPQLFPSVELYLQSIRSSIFQKLEVIPWGYLPTLIAPDFYGNPVTRNDWFGHYAEWNGYFGFISLILAFFSFKNLKDKKILFFLISSVFTLLLAFPTPFLDLLVSLKIPVLSTSALGRIIVIFSFSGAVLAAFGFDTLIDLIKKREKKWIFVVFSLFLLILLNLWAIIALKLFIPLDKLFVARQNLILPTVLFFLLLIFVVFEYMVGDFLRRKLKIHLAFSLIVVILLSLEVVRFSTKWMPFDPKFLIYPNVKVIEKLLEIPKTDRIYGNLGGEATTYLKLSSIEGYDPLYIRSYGEFIASLDKGVFEESARSVVSFPKQGINSEKGLNLLGVKYFVHKRADGQNSWVFPFWELPRGQFTLIYDDDVYQIFRNNSSFERAFLVGDYKVEKDRNAILSEMFDKDLKKTVYLEEDPNINLSFKNGSAKIVEYTPNRITISTSSDGNSLLFLSDIFYPGWVASVDRNSTKIYRADYTFRAVEVPKGEHKVVFEYSPVSFKNGVVGALVGGFLMILFPLFRFPKLKLRKF